MSRFDAVLTAHELTHAAQPLLNPAWEAADYPLGAHAFPEGLATFLSALAYPGHADDEHLWFDSTHQHWLRDCEQAWPTAAAALQQVLDEPCGGAADLLTLDIPTTQRLVHRRLDDGHLPAAQPSR